MGGRTLVQEVACSYKSVQASRLVTEVIRKVNLGEILTQLSEAQSASDELRKLVIRARDLQESIAENEEKLLSGSVRKRDRGYLEDTIAKEKDLRVEILAEAAKLQGQDQTQFYSLIAEVLPVVMEEAPEVVWRFCALMMTPNTDLMELYKEGQNAIKERLDEEQAWLMFNTQQFEALEIAAFFLPAVGFDMLKKAGGTLLESLLATLIETRRPEEAAPEPKAEATTETEDSGESSKSLSASSESGE